MSRNTPKHEGKSPHNRKDAMAVKTFLRGPFRVITNSLNEDELEAYKKSKMTRRPEAMSNGILVQAIETGEWFYSLLYSKLHKKGKSFRLGMISNKDLHNAVTKGKWTVDGIVDGSQFAWANASYTFFLRVDGEVDFGLESLGLHAISGKKTSKRLQEIARITQMSSEGEMSDLNYKMLDMDALGYDEVIFDGGIFATESFMLKACESIPNQRTRRHHEKMIKNRQIGPMIARIVMDKGIVKGLLHVVADGQIEADVIFDRTALKSEIRTVDGTWHFTAFRHKMLHKGMWDMQTATNNHTWLTTEERFKQDLATIPAELRAMIATGDLPDWILYQEEESHDDDNMVKHDHVTAYWLNAAKRLAHAKLQLNQIPVTAFANIMKMAYGSVENQMRAALGNKRMWVPMSQSFVANVITAEALEMMGNFDLDMDNKDLNDKIWFHEQFGVVFPGYRFADTAELHDTWDQDGDNALFVRIKLWSSDGSVTQNRKRFNVIPSRMEVPSNKEDAIDACVVIRRPNSPGGYSIEMVDVQSMPFMRTEIEPQLIDLAITPPSLAELLANVAAGTIHSAKQYSGRKMQRDEAKAMITGQAINPGVGSFANAVMVHASMFGPSFPDCLVAQGNDVIDIVQQESDAVAFGQIKDGVDLMWQDLARLDADIDSYILATRVPVQYQDGDNHSWSVVEGSWTRMYKQYLETLNEVSAIARQATFDIRQSSSFAQMITREIPTLSANLQQWCRQFFAKYDPMLTHSDKMFRVSAKADRFVKSNAAADRSDYVSEIVQQMVDDIKATAYPEKYAVALYRWIIDPQMTGMPFGVSDRILVQGAKAGQETVMDLFIEGVLTLD